MAQLHSPAVGQPDGHPYLPGCAIPGVVVIAEVLILLAQASAAARHATEPDVERGVPARLPGFVGAVDQIQARRQRQHLLGEGAERMRVDRLYLQLQRFQVDPTIQGAQPGEEDTTALLLTDLDSIKDVADELTAHRRLPADGLQVVAGPDVAQADDERL